MDTQLRTLLISGIKDGSIVPYLGPGALADVVSATNGMPIPATSEALILAMNGGKPMAPKLMYEFPRAAMNVELKRGRGAVTRFLDTTYGQTLWSRSSLHDWLKTLRPAYVIDINRDTQLLESYADTAHYLILGCARVSGQSFRFKLYGHDGAQYTELAPDAPNIHSLGLPVLFKPMGAPLPKSSYIASDADYVDYITELMGGFAVPAFVKSLRKNKRYLLLGMRFVRDTERMVFSDLIYDAGTPAGWALIDNPTDKERRFLHRQGIEIIETNVQAWVEEASSCHLPECA